LHWWAAGDELPARTPDWFLNLWPSRPMHWLVCRLFGHVEGHDYEHGYRFTYCVWCQRVLWKP
jgi:hypothetical protein